MFLVSFFFANQCGRAKKKHKVPEKNTKFQYAIQTLLALGAYSYERTLISFTVLDKPPNINYCRVSHYSLSVGSNVIHVYFTGSLPSLCFESITMLSLLPLLLAAGPLHASLAPTRAADRMHGLVSLKHGSCYCQRTLVATHIANLRVSAPGRLVRWLDNSGAFSILSHHDLAVQLMLGREERGSTYIHFDIECLLQCQQLARCQLLCGEHQSKYSALASQLSALAFPESQLLLPSAHHTSRSAGANLREPLHRQLL